MCAVFGIVMKSIEMMWNASNKTRGHRIFFSISFFLSSFFYSALSKMAIFTIDCKSLVELKLIDSEQPEWTHRCLSICVCERVSRTWCEFLPAFPFHFELNFRNNVEITTTTMAMMTTTPHTHQTPNIPIGIQLAINRRVLNCFSRFETNLARFNHWSSICLVAMCTNIDAFATHLSANLCRCNTYLLLLFPFFLF